MSVLEKIGGYGLLKGRIAGTRRIAETNNKHLQGSQRALEDKKCQVFEFEMSQRDSKPGRVSQESSTGNLSGADPAASAVLVSLEEERNFLGARD